MNIWLGITLIFFSFLFGFIIGWFCNVLYGIAREQLKAVGILARTPWRKAIDWVKWRGK